MEDNALREIKVRQLKCRSMVTPNFNKPMVLRTDASDVGIGATLSQESEYGNIHLVACHSKKSGTENTYPVHEKEMLALVDTLEEWRHDLLGTDVTLLTIWR